ncbi:hypothetical protein BDP27DRAFT_1447246 [Rhodocollybia butyracea]|uniref:Uncharacterized protein n=1 Tax=Rhodocollybia butyracea TaxID=206335 RepID=A0A9P5PXW4_9AGAR|nr:hypothetical protein BDP27DRAFT_1447246 [Rhodocollybia butyracea]
MQRRGRSRQISFKALARQASEERERQQALKLKRLGKFPEEVTLSEVSADEQLIDLTGPEDECHTLIDQLHIAYAFDDLPLAKMLLLKITQDIQDITSRTDPRLDSVKPEDFDVVFLPKGGLMTPKDEARLAERQEKERERLEKEAEKAERERKEQEELERIQKEEKERVEREKAWETWVDGVWGNAKREMEQMVLTKKRQGQVEEDKRQRADKRHGTPRISYAHLSTTRDSFSSSSPPELLYTIPNIPKLSPQRKRIRPSGNECGVILPRKLEPIGGASLLLESPETISFHQVLTAMRGKLFPLVVEPETKLDLRQRSKTPDPFYPMSVSISPPTQQQRRDAALLAGLLETTFDDADRLKSRREHKGTTVEMRKSVINSPAMSRLPCAACSSASSSSSPSRSGSWLSFMSSSSSQSSVSTVLTTPSSSPPIKNRTGSVFSSWFKNSPTQCTCDAVESSLTCSPNGTMCRFVPVPNEKSPLPLDEPSCLVSWEAETFSSSLDASFGGTAKSRTTSSASPNTLLRSMAHLYVVAKSFQTAYMHAAMTAAVASVPSFANEWDREYDSEYERKRTRINVQIINRVKSKLQPVGSRVDKKEVARFISKNASGDTDEVGVGAGAGQGMTVPTGFRPKIIAQELFSNDDSIQYIPLVPSNPSQHPPRTILPDPLPFPIHFKPQRSLNGSPVRRAAWVLEQQQQHTNTRSSKRRIVSPPRYGPNGFRRSRRSLSPPIPTSAENPVPTRRQTPIPRHRFVSNPVYLRLKALQNCTGIPVTDTDGNSIRVVDGPDLVSMSIKGGVLSCGREKVPGLAFEDLGRSRLGRVDLDLGETRRLRDSNTPISIPWWQGRDVAGLGGRTESRTKYRQRIVISFIIS